MTGYEWDFPPLRHSLGTRATFNPLTCPIADAIELTQEKWFLPPAVTPDGIKPCVTVETAKAFIQSLATNFAMNDLVARPQSLSLTHFPAAARTELVGMVRGRLGRLCSQIG